MFRAGRLPILTYHQVGRFSPETVRRQRGNYVDLDRFRRQVRLLRAFGCRAVTLAQAADWLLEGRPLPRRAVAFTFDDAYQGIYQHAAPLFHEAGWAATTFVVSQEVGGQNAWDLPKGIEAAPLMDAEELRTLAEQGWEIGGHSRTHARLAGAPAEELAREVAGAREELGALLGREPEAWCYPYGSLDGAVVSAVRAAGYRTAVTLRHGAARRTTLPLLLPRIHVGYRIGAARFLWRLISS